MNERRGAVGNESVGEKEIENLLTYHPPTEEQRRRFNVLTGDIIDLANQIDVICPHSREKSLAITKLQECRMWANAAIAIHPELLK